MTAEELAAHLRAIGPLTGVPLVTFARRMGLVPQGMTDEEWQTQAREQFANDWQRYCEEHDRERRSPHRSGSFRRALPVWLRFER